MDKRTPSVTKHEWSLQYAPTTETLQEKVEQRLNAGWSLVGDSYFVYDPHNMWCQALKRTYQAFKQQGEQ